MLSIEKSDKMYLRVVIKYDMQHSFKLMITDTEDNLKAKTFAQLRLEMADKYKKKGPFKKQFYFLRSRE